MICAAPMNWSSCIPNTTAPNILKINLRKVPLKRRRSKGSAHTAYTVRTSTLDRLLQPVQEDVFQDQGGERVL